MVAVGIFFVLSGYFITLTLRRSYLDGLAGVGRFWVNRALRLYPVYPLALPRQGMPLQPFSLAGSLPNLTLWGLANPLSDSERPVIPAMWSLGVELPVYLVMSVWAARSGRAAQQFLSLSVILAMASLLLYNNVSLASVAVIDRPLARWRDGIRQEGPSRCLWHSVLTERLARSVKHSKVSGPLP